LAPGSFIIFNYKNKGHDKTEKTNPSKDNIKEAQDKKQDSKKIRILNPTFFHNKSPFLIFYIQYCWGVRGVL